MSYSDYKKMSEYDQYALWGEHQSYNKLQQKRKSFKEKEQKLIDVGIIEIVHLSDEEQKEFQLKLREERNHRNLSERSGGIDSRGNYTSLHHRWD